MKLQLHGQRLRFRIDEAELARLLDGQTLADQTRLGPVQLHERRLHLHDGTTAALDWKDGNLALTLPRTAIEDYVTGLPRRDALRFVLGEGEAALHLDFDVDVRDSMRTRRPQAALQP
ncbi:MAG: hypothetical protein JNN30_13910 [Rhodanobacteraceae bacterium]|jgi:hypothetical protein|uniref:Uncharacterized protein n=1 Tax=Tahibacter aquaticus TaxID=520092 RepID=A0A4R6YML9_9GAMM|nr:hypothetical protein [Tahibacter aquaticus]MBL8299429.1 hypothetical protein [Rhodanobacteraceae bacterium]TDR38555.1 hypothetical protein DFR29_12056 [Tahibacter aquaticus]